MLLSSSRMQLYLGRFTYLFEPVPSFVKWTSSQGCSVSSLLGLILTCTPQSHSTTRRTRLSLLEAAGTAACRSAVQWFRCFKTGPRDGDFLANRNALPVESRGPLATPLQPALVNLPQSSRNNLQLECGSNFCGKTLTFPKTWGLFCTLDLPFSKCAKDRPPLSSTFTYQE